MTRNFRRGMIAIFWVLALGWAALLFFFSGQSAEASGALSRMVTELILKLFPFIRMSVEELHPILRKIAHFGIFAVEGLLLGLAVMCSLRRIVRGGALAALICAAAAAANEYHQTFSVGRSCEYRDMLIDSGGALLGVIVAGLLVWACVRGARRRNVIC